MEISRRMKSVSSRSSAKESQPWEDQTPTTPKEKVSGTPSTPSTSTPSTSTPTGKIIPNKSKFGGEHMVLKSLPNGRFGYSRVNTEEGKILEEILAKMHGVRHCHLAPSGMSALCVAGSVVLRNMRGRRICLITPDESYNETHGIARNLCDGRRYDLKEYSTADPSSLKKVYENAKDSYDACVLFTEVCSNPNGNMIDLAYLNSILEENGNLAAILDNTWLSHVGCNPFDLIKSNNVYVVNSLTKYYSGGNAIMGSILTRNDFMSDWFRKRITGEGLYVCQYNCICIAENVPSIEERMKAAEIRTLDIIAELVNNQKCVIKHPSLRASEDPYKVIKVMPSVFTVTVRTRAAMDIDRVKNILENSGLEFKTSYGGPMSRLDRWPTVNGTSVTFRISVGYNDDPSRVIIEANKLIDKFTA